MINSKLKPCPLCGGKAAIQHLCCGTGVFEATIVCEVCGLRLDWNTQILTANIPDCNTVAKIGLDPIEAWNRRATNE